VTWNAKPTDRAARRADRDDERVRALQISSMDTSSGSQSSQFHPNSSGAEQRNKECDSQ